jgi:hypothetical protein
MIYTAPLRNAFDAGKSITRASGRGLSSGNQDFFGPCENGIEPLGECRLGPLKVNVHCNVQPCCHWSLLSKAMPLATSKSMIRGPCGRC